MTHHVAADMDPGSWCPPTRRRAELDAQDARRSEELARQCGTRSWRETHPEDGGSPAPAKAAPPPRVPTSPAIETMSEAQLVVLSNRVTRALVAKRKADRCS